MIISVADGVFQITLGNADLPVSIAQRLMGVVGMATMLGLAWLYSVRRREVNWRLVAMGVGLQVVVAVVVLKTAFGRAFFTTANAVFVRLLGFTEQGSRFLFGNLVKNNVPIGTPTGSPADMAPLDGVTMWANTGGYVAFTVLPIIIFFSALTAVLYHLGVMQRLVQGIAWVMQRTMGTSGAETLSVAGNIFVGHTESPLLIRPFIGSLTMSELHTVMVGGLATIAGSVMAAYIGILSPYFPDIAGHLLTASVINAPAAIVISKILFPESERPETSGSVRVNVEKTDVNVIEAAASGTATGLQLALNVGAMLLAFIALIALLNYLFAAVGGLIGLPQLSLEYILGIVLAPLAWLMGVPWADAGTVGSLVGVKVVFNEFIAYLQLAQVMESAAALSRRGALIATYALLGFANFASIAIAIAGIGGLAPERKSDLARLGIRAMIGGNLAAFMSASLVGMLL